LRRNRPQRINENAAAFLPSFRALVRAFSATALSRNAGWMAGDWIGFKSGETSN
jgi:hypothetical protein